MSDMAVLLYVAGGGHPSEPTADECGGLPIPRQIWTIARNCWGRVPEERPTTDDILSQLMEVP
jgi:hypothetical protein